MRSAKLFLAAVFVVVLPWSTSCGARAAESSKGTVRIGLLDPVSGTYATEGREVDSGFRYYLATHGDELGGFHVELRTADEGSSPDSALASAHQLVEQDMVDAIVGLVNSSDALGIADYVDAQKMPLVIAGAGADGLTQGTARKTFFRVAHTSSQDVMPLGDYVCRKLGRKTAAILAVDAPYGWESAGGFARTYTDAGCRVLQETYVAGDDTDWNALVAKLDRRARVIFVSISSLVAQPFLEAFRASTLKTTLVGSGLLTDESVLSQERDLALGAITSLHYAATLPSSQNTAFRLGYESLGGQPVSQLAENGYVAAEALGAALARLPTGPVRGDALALEMRGVTLQAPRGALRFDAYGQVVDAVYVRRVRQVGGRFRNDVIETYPNVSQFWRYDPARYLQLPSYDKLKGTWARP
jgi:branched-chain amino acid transport system substrate-binding protein